MKHILQAWPATILAIAILLVSCDESTGSLGVYPGQDAVTTSYDSFDILSSSIANNNVPASSTACYLGKVIDPELDKAITATFAAQFHIFENYAFPDKGSIAKTDGHLCDSIDIKLIIKSTFGAQHHF